MSNNLHHRRHFAIGFRESCQKITKQILEECPDFFLELWPDGEFKDGAYLIYNPHREDHGLGSFRICYSGSKPGCWRDFAVQDKKAGGRDFVSLIAYYMNWPQSDSLQFLRQQFYNHTNGRRVRAISKTMVTRSAP